MKRVKESLGWRHGGRGVAVLGVFGGAAMSIGELVSGVHVFDAVWRGCVIALLAMAVLGAARSLWMGDDVEEAEAGGVRVKFGAARRAIGELNTRVTSQMADVNRRLYDLEKTVFKNRDPDTEQR